MTESKADVPYGTLDLLVLRTLEVMGPMHGFGIARRIEQVAENLVHLNQGSIYPALLRLQQKGWITTKWGTSENGRRAKFYSLTKKGKQQLQVEVENWERATSLSPGSWENCRECQGLVFTSVRALPQATA